ncbi:pyruvate flavodoxin/ferredoxin oxidoreductase domain protein [Chlorobium limicola DSM 245]|uniref:Pyruvate flavodoxin/ferredoxin oxidoreductase domain protein n=2 Tax=Chlorobium limicola TaxID=1092 RepID=B3ECB7_CHLL2|nr:pyruvate flavodoxin/ferredoxin oxidoreductase domain protein [Chlorobium limicola DSM 245]
MRIMSDFSMVFEGAAGQGVQTITRMLLPVLKNCGHHVFACTEFMSRIRGGSNTTEIRVTEKSRQAYVRRIDMLFALSPKAHEHLDRRIDGDTLVFAESEQCAFPSKGNCIATPVKALALEAGSPVFSNTVVVGMVLGLLGIPLEELDALLHDRFHEKGEEIVLKNITAATLGYDWGRNCPEAGNIDLPHCDSDGSPAKLLMDGTSALGIGAIAAGCNFISSYPMSPSTGLLTFLAEKSDAFGVVVDQAEDEIAAINAGLGASYAGARAVVTTSGGGFDLMQEGVSLAGMLELPIVIHIGQRPGPATGLPTRTEQGDFNLVLHAGHGEFARAIFAPGTLEELMHLAQRAFAVAHRFHIPVFLLTDQFLLDAETIVEAAAIQRFPVEEAIVETGEEYLPYRFTEDGLSPRGVPGYGAGLVRADSDEHSEAGFITEDFDVRRRMVEKRLARLGPLSEEALMPTVTGLIDNARTLVVGWGSNRGVIEEALDLFGDPHVAGLHFSQLYPLNPAVASLLGDRKLIVLENNPTGQFAAYLAIETGKNIAGRILKATGEPFSVEEVVEALRKEVGHE